MLIVIPKNNALSVEIGASMVMIALVCGERLALKNSEVLINEDGVTAWADECDSRHKCEKCGTVYVE